MSKAIYINEAAYVDGITSLSTAISTTSTGITSLSSAISSESSIRSSTDSVLSTAISTETSSRISGDSSLTTAISSESSVRTSADTSLSTSISSESSIRASADISLSTAIGNVDMSSLSTAISTESSVRASADTSLSTAISSETSSRISGDSSLTTALSNEISTTDLEITSLSTAIGSIEPTMSLTGLTDVEFTGLENNDMMYYSGDTWRNTPRLWTESNSAVTLSNENYDLSLSNIEVIEDGGTVSLINMNVTSGETQGTEESYSFDINGNPIVRIYSESDGAGSVQNTGLVLDAEYFYMGNPVTNGSWRWFLNVDGDLEFQKRIGGEWIYKTKLT